MRGPTFSGQRLQVQWLALKCWAYLNEIEPVVIPTDHNSGLSSLGGFLALFDLHQCVQIVVYDLATFVWAKLQWFGCGIRRQAINTFYVFTLYEGQVVIGWGLTHVCLLRGSLLLARWGWTTPFICIYYRKWGVSVLNQSYCCIPSRKPVQLKAIKELMCEVKEPGNPNLLFFKRLCFPSLIFSIVIYAISSLLLKYIFIQKCTSTPLPKQLVHRKLCLNLSGFTCTRTFR